MGCAAWLFGLAAAFPVAGQPAGTAALPFVGCASDGQTGPAAAPSAGAPTPALPAAAARQLAYYATEDLGAIAPRGWHCFGLQGADGTVLIVTPERQDPAAFLGRSGRLAGPVVQLSRISGGTSGRVRVARIAARLFPAARSFVEGVIAEGAAPAASFQFRPFPADLLTRRSNTVVEFRTPGGGEGLGTENRLTRDEQPISGVVILLPAEEMDLVKLDIRLPPELRPLADAIVQEVLSSHGTPRSGPAG